MRRLGLAASLALLGACAATPPVEPGAAAPQPPVARESAATVVPEPPPPEFPAVVVRLRRIDNRFVAEIVDVRGAEPDPRPLVGEARRDAVRRLETLLGDRVRVVDGGS